MPANSDTKNREQPGLEYSQWKRHWDEIGRDGQKAAVKSFYEREKLATPNGVKSQLDIQREALTKQLKTLLEDFLGVLRTTVDVAIANEWIEPSMSPMIMPVLTAIEKGVSEFPHDKRALTIAEISMSKVAFN